MGKVEDNKLQKLNALFESAYGLFMNNGIEKTSIHDIVQKAGVAKGTFYLYFKDKYDIRDRLIAKTAEKLFISAYSALNKCSVPSFEDKIIFIVDYIIDQLRENKLVLRFISKNLSWGIFRKALFSGNNTSEINFLQFYHSMLEDNPDVKLRAPETMLFLIIELASSASYSTILDNDPISYDELKPYLNESIRAIIRNHIVSEAAPAD
ncbi:TetR/AcrR family transcriptional regulator [Hespellia stercorisuis]|uniref:Transcriptional regulator, TetR family n=1 Tax=Hespellia stercorisuis DSM 15480 TaxID=1121950 RepID=A0A1M6HR50_9FIRM|nr:TetR/AcrR family transcriptional regulator [Hespellia stercorisuis]SHJ24685.1 transcriptional regulator, TetR family [Hespellia stercorisuis DSM 15480]